MTTGSEIIAAVRDILNDDGTRWDDVFLLRHLNAGQDFIVEVAPQANAVTVYLPLGVGEQRVSIPEDGIRLLDVTHNGGNVVGGIETDLLGCEAITRADEAVLSRFSPAWRRDRSNIIKHYFFDPAEPTMFGIYPASDGWAVINITYSARPVHLSSGGNDITLNSRYHQALVEWCLFRALSAETDASDTGAASSHLQVFFNLLGLDEQAIAKWQPKVVG